MRLDIRLPLGMLFTITGAIMTVYGFLTRGSAIYAISDGLDINLIWGLLLVTFGVVMWISGRRRT